MRILIMTYYFSRLCTGGFITQSHHCFIRSFCLCVTPCLSHGISLIRSFWDKKVTTMDTEHVINLGALIHCAISPLERREHTNVCYQGFNVKFHETYALRALVVSASLYNRNIILIAISISVIMMQCSKGTINCFILCWIIGFIWHLLSFN